MVPFPFKTGDIVDVVIGDEIVARCLEIKALGDDTALLINGKSIPLSMIQPATVRC